MKVKKSQLLRMTGWAIPYIEENAKLLVKKYLKGETKKTFSEKELTQVLEGFLIETFEDLEKHRIHAIVMASDAYVKRHRNDKHV